MNGFVPNRVVVTVRRAMRRAARAIALCALCALAHRIAPVVAPVPPSRAYACTATCDATTPATATACGIGNATNAWCGDDDAGARVRGMHRDAVRRRVRERRERHGERGRGAGERDKVREDVRVLQRDDEDAEQRDARDATVGGDELRTGESRDGSDVHGGRRVAHGVR